MSWAASRETTRPEDMAYCLFGLFDVHLTPLYGEGAEKAFRRLQEEIIRTSMDLSFLAWSRYTSSERNKGLVARSGLASTPRDFLNDSHISFELSRQLEPFHMTNKGLCVTLPIAKRSDHEGHIVILPNCYQFGSGTPIGICVLPMASNDDLFQRDTSAPGRIHYSTVSDDVIGQAESKRFYIHTRDEYFWV